MNISDLSSLASPDVVESVDFDVLLDEYKQELSDRDDTWSADVESDPSVKLLEVAAYRRLLSKQRINEAALAVLLPWSSGTTLDALVSFFGITRLVITEADDTTTPPTEAVYESNDELKARALLAWQAVSTAGPRGSYIYHALSASSQVKSAYAYRIQAGDVALVIQSRDGSGVADQALLDTVSAAVNPEEVRPLCSEAVVQSVVIYEYQIAATLYVDDISLKDSIESAALTKGQAYVAAKHVIKGFVSKSAIEAALHVTGVVDVDLGGFAGYEADRDTTPYCTSFTVTAVLRDANG